MPVSLLTYWHFRSVVFLYVIQKNTQIEQFNLVCLWVNEDIGGFDIFVNDPMTM